jgi:hypothetical protein
LSQRQHSYFKLIIDYSCEDCVYTEVGLGLVQTSPEGKIQRETPLVAAVTQPPVLPEKIGIQQPLFVTVR